jgi:hypothetical protein
VRSGGFRLLTRKRLHPGRQTTCFSSRGTVPHLVLVQEYLRHIPGVQAAPIVLWARTNSMPSTVRRGLLTGEGEWEAPGVPDANEGEKVKTPLVKRPGGAIAQGGGGVRDRAWREARW